ncbi:hypothetical protein SUGI_0103220 [Cryptomeria japonica]|nr:hypothetical protein SUGI_0103220 [Cryptomeria japonica]
MARTTIVVAGNSDVISQQSIQRLLSGVRGFQSVERVEGRTVIVIHDAGSQDRIVIELRRTYRNAQATDTAE